MPQRNIFCRRALAGLVAAVSIVMAGCTGRHGDALRVRVKAPPVGGRANAEVAALLAAALHVPGHDVTLVAGATSRLKRFLIAGIGQGRAKECLTRALDGNGA